MKLLSVSPWKRKGMRKSKFKLAGWHTTHTMTHFCFGKREKRFLAHNRRGSMKKKVDLPFCRAGFFLASLSLVTFSLSSRSIDSCSSILFNWHVVCSWFFNCYPESVLLRFPRLHYLPSDPIALLARSRESKQINPLPWISTLDRLPVRRFQTGLVTWTVE